MPTEDTVSYPYILVGAELLTDRVIKSYSSSHYITLHIWTATEGQIEMKSIISDITDRLLYKKLPLPKGYEVGRRKLRLSSIHREIDANREQLHGVVQYDFDIIKEEC